MAHRFHRRARCGGAFPSVETALDGLAAEAPDVLLLDIHLPGLTGSEAVGKALRQRLIR